MATGLREWLQTTVGKATAAGVCVLGLALALWMIYGSLGTSRVSLSTDRVFIDATTGEPFEYTVQKGDTIPVQAPSGDRSGYPAEPCYWTADGQVKEEPTWVLVAEYKGEAGPTFCPECGHLVTRHNPIPQPGDSPPPKQ